MLLPKKELSPELREKLVAYTYDVIGYVHDVARQLPCGLPEYVYQEAFAQVL